MAGNDGREIDVKSIGFLIDELISTNLKCWFAQEAVQLHEISGNHKACAEAAVAAQRFNARRNQLIRAIDRRFGEVDISPTEKTYG